MILKKVILKNIRNHKFFEFEPNLTGTIAITGENGAGKSSILNAFAFSLFGTKSQDLKIKDYIKEGINPKNDECSVTSFIIIGNREYKIEKKIKSLSGTCECNIYSKGIDEEEFSFECGPSVSHSDRFIRMTLGMDEKTFYSSIFVQQKQVDQIILSTPKERTQVIEQMMGVNAITESIKIAKEESKDLQKSLAVIQPGDIEEIENSLKTQEEVVKNIKEKGRNAQAKNTVLENEFSLLSEKYNIEKNKMNEFRVKQNELNIINNDIKNYNERLTENLDNYNRLNKDNIVYSEELHKELNQTYKKQEEELKKLESDCAVLENVINQQRKIVEITFEDNLEEKYKKLEDNQTELKESEQEVITEIKMCELNIKNNKIFINDLHNGVGECPYCKSPITDIEKELKHHENELEKDNSKLIELKDKYNSIKNKINFNLNELLKLQEVIAKKKEYDTILPKFKKNEKDIEVIKANIITQKKVFEVTQKQLADMNVIKSQQDMILSAKATIKMLNETLIKKNEDKIKCENELNQINALTEKEFNQLEKDYQSKQAEINNVKLEINSLLKDLEIEKLKGREIQNQLDRCVKAKNDYETISKKLTLINTTINDLSKFKEMRIDSSIPSLNEIGSELLQNFSSGKFIELKLNKDFEVSVKTRQGTERSINLLSGGELSAVAIALRIAIALFLHNGQPNLLILDEILVSMSEDVQLNILETISKISSSQIILIAHSQVANSFADQLIKL